MGGRDAAEKPMQDLILGQQGGTCGSKDQGSENLNSEPSAHEQDFIWMSTQSNGPDLFSHSAARSFFRYHTNLCPNVWSLLNTLLTIKLVFKGFLSNRTLLTLKLFRSDVIRNSLSEFTLPSVKC